MKSVLAKPLFFVMLLFAAAVLAEGGLHHHGPTVDGAWIRQAPPVATVTAGYLTIHNPNEKPLVLEGADSPLFARVEFHRTRMDGGMAAMERQASVTIPPHGRVEFAPGGLHLMLFGPEKLLQVGEAVTINLRFEGGRNLPVSFSVRSWSGEKTQHGHHQHH